MNDRDKLDLLEIMPMLVNAGIKPEQFREVNLPGRCQLVVVYPTKRALEELRLTFATKKERRDFLANLRLRIG